jgi:hypothetical protein
MRRTVRQIIADFARFLLSPPKEEEAATKRRQALENELARFSPSYTKKGPGRRHVYGDSPNKRPSGHFEFLGDRNKSAWLPDSLDKKWKLSPTQRRERENANGRRMT